MSNSNGIISAPIDLRRDAYAVTGTSPLNGGYSLVHLCQSGKINKWAIFKPIPCNKIFVHLTDTVTFVNPFNGTATQARACIGTPKREYVTIDGTQMPLFVFYGIGMPMFTGQDLNPSFRRTWIKNLNTHPEWNWPYYPPKGGESEPCRLTDLLGYNHFAESPIELNAYDVFSSTQGSVRAKWSSGDNTCVELRELAGFLNMDLTLYCDVWTADGSFYETVELGKLADSEEETAMIGPYGVSSTRDLEAYFYAQGKNGTDVWTLLMPSTPEYPNPVPFQAHASTGSQQESILRNINWYSAEFAWTHSSTYWESFDNVGENLYSRLVTSAYYCFEVELVNNTNADVTINAGDISFWWNEFPKKSNTSGVSYQFRCYVSGTMVSSFNVPAKSGIYLQVEMSDIFDPARQMGYSVPDNAQYGNIDSMDMFYKGIYVGGFYCAVLKCASGDPHNGWFYSDIEGYYQSR